MTVDAISGLKAVGAVQIADSELIQGLMGRSGRPATGASAPPAARDRAESARKAGKYLYRLAPGDVIYESVYFHYSFVNDALRPDSLDKLNSEEIILWSHDKENVRYTVHLTTSKPGGFYPSEGELSLDFRRNNYCVYVLSFTFVPSCYFSAAGFETIFIGRMQGLFSFHEARLATKGLFEITPQAVLFAALRGIATALGIPAIVGVGASSQLSFAEDRRAMFEKQYDGFFESAGAKRVDGFYLAPSHAASKPLSEIRADRRRRTGLKRSFKQGVSDAVSLSFSDLLHVAPARVVSNAGLGETCAPSPATGSQNYASLLRYRGFAAESREHAQELTRLRAEVEKARQDNERNAATLAEQQAEISHLRAELRQARQALESNASAVVERQNEIGALRSEIKGLRDHVFDLAGQLLAVSRSSAGVQADLRRLKEALATAERDHAATIDNLNEAFAQIVAKQFKSAGRRPFWMRRREFELRLLKMGVFDEKYYLANNPDVAAAAVDPVRHYHENGHREGRDPNRFFNTRKYLEANRDVAKAGVNPLVHYCLYGASEGRKAIYGR